MTSHEKERGRRRFSIPLGFREKKKRKEGYNASSTPAEGEGRRAFLLPTLGEDGRESSLSSYLRGGGKGGERSAKSSA